MRIDKLADSLSSLLPPELGKELRHSIENRLQTHFSEMNLVTREQFDVQRRVLAKTREKLAQLEQRLADLEDDS